MNKFELIQQLHEKHRNLLLLVQDFTPRDFEAPCPNGAGNIKELFAHLAGWNWWAEQAITTLLQNKSPTTFLETCDAVAPQKNALPQPATLNDILADFWKSHRALLNVVESAVEGDLMQTRMFKNPEGQNISAIWVASFVIQRFQESYLRLKGSLQPSLPNPLLQVFRPYPITTIGASLVPLRPTFA